MPLYGHRRSRRGGPVEREERHLVTGPEESFFFVGKGSWGTGRRGIGPWPFERKDPGGS